MIKREQIRKSGNGEKDERETDRLIPGGCSHCPHLFSEGIFEVHRARFAL